MAAFDFFTVSMLWTVIAAALVFVMHLGFATLEAGLTQSKNTVNILSRMYSSFRSVCSPMLLQVSTPTLAENGLLWRLALVR